MAPNRNEWAADGIGLGVRMGRYELTSFVGAGGMGMVFAARDPELDRMVAVKILPSRNVAGSEGETRLRREGQTMARFAHPNVIRVYDVGVANGHPFVAMELIAGGTLGQWLAKQPRATSAILAMFAQAGRGLAAAHDAGLVHRDFKPSNVLVDDDGRVLVTDFGLARPVIGGAAGTFASVPAASPAAVTNPGQLAGTPAYMAPEQHAGDTIDARADQFSFCVALWRALYGKAPYAGATIEELAAATSRGVLTPPPGPAAARVPPKVRAALERGLRPKAADRFGSLRELLAVLEPPANGGRTFWWVATLGVTAVVGVSAWTIARPKDGGRGAGADPCASSLDSFAGVWDGGARARRAGGLPRDARAVRRGLVPRGGTPARRPPWPVGGDATRQLRGDAGSPRTVRYDDGCSRGVPREAAHRHRRVRDRAARRRCRGAAQRAAGRCRRR